jgi:hypothetical protein
LPPQLLNAGALPVINWLERTEKAERAGRTERVETESQEDKESGIEGIGCGEDRETNWEDTGGRESGED